MINQPERDGNPAPRAKGSLPVFKTPLMTNAIVLARVIESRNHKRPLFNNRRRRHKTTHMKRMNIPDELKRFDPKENGELTDPLDELPESSDASESSTEGSEGAE